MVDRCITVPERERIAKNALAMMTKEQKENLGITEDNKEDALRMIGNTIGSWAGTASNDQEVEERSNNIDLIYEHLIGLTEQEVPEEKYDDVSDIYDSFMEGVKAWVPEGIGKFYVFDIDRDSYKSKEDFDKEVAALTALFEAHKAVLDTQDISKDGNFSMIVFVKNPIKMDYNEEQAKVLRAIDRIKAASRGFDYKKDIIAKEYRDPVNPEETKIIKKKDPIPDGWEKTGWYLYEFNGRRFWNRSVTNDVAGRVDTSPFPILSGFIGNQLDAVGRDFFDKKSNIWKFITVKKNNKIKINDQGKAEEYILSNLHSTFTVKGLENLLNDFLQLQNQLEEKWGTGLTFYSGDLMLFGGKGKKGDIDAFVSGKPDLLVVDKKGIVHVLDFKCKKMILSKEDHSGIARDVYTKPFDHPGYKGGMSDRVRYQEQISRYIRILESYGFTVDTQPYVVLADTWYESKDYGTEGNKQKEQAGEKTKSVYRMVGNKYENPDFTIMGEDQSKEEQDISLADFAATENYGREDVINAKEAEQDEDLDSGIELEDILYIEPRLHTAGYIPSTVPGIAGTMSDTVEALRGEGELEFNEDLSYESLFNAMEEEDKQIIQSLGGDPVVREVHRGIVSYGDDVISSRPDIIDMEECQRVAEAMMYEVSALIDEMRAGSNYIKWEKIDKPKEAFIGKSHEEIIRIAGLQNLIDYVFEKHIENKYTEGLPTYTEEQYKELAGSLDNRYRDKFARYKNWKDYKKRKALNDKAWWLSKPRHKRELIEMGASKLMALEESVTPKVIEQEGFNPEAPDMTLPVDNTDIRKDTGADGEMQNLVDKRVEGLTDIEAWMLGQRNYSPKVALAKEVRRLIERIEILDEKGVPEVDNWGFRKHIDSTQAVQYIEDIVKDCETIKEMYDALTRAASEQGKRWVKTFLETLQKPGNGQLMTKFYRHFRKDCLTYSVCKYTTDSKGKAIIVTQIINQRSALDTIRQSLGASFNAGSVGQYKMEGSEKTLSLLETVNGRFRFTTIVGRSTVAGLIKDDISKIRVKIKTIYNNRRQREEGQSLEDYIMGSMRDQGIIASIANVLNGVGILVNEKVVENFIAKKVKGELSNNASQLLKWTEGIIGALEDVAEDKKLEGGIPHTLKGNAAYYRYIDVLKKLADSVEEAVEASVYYDGKTYYSYSNPSRLGHIIRNINDSLDTDLGNGDESKFSNYIQKNFGRYTGWFKSIDGSEWWNDWLNQICSPDALKHKVTDKNLAREVLAHKVELAYIGNQYKNLGSLGFQLSILHNYFGDASDEALHKRARWFALPTMSNKPTNEFIRMLKYKDVNQGGKDEIIDRVLMNTFKQEMSRIADVLYHFRNHSVQGAEIDITDSKLKNAGWTQEEINSFKNRIDNKKVSLQDLIKLSHITSGAKFHFLWYLNNEMIENHELGTKVTAMVNQLLTPKNKAFDSDTLSIVRKAIASNMEEIVKDELKRMEEIGLFDTEERKDKNGNIYHVLKYQEQFDGKLGEGNDRSKMEEALTDFIWQDIAANINIIQITGGDLAYYGNSVNYQKRIAMIHSPGLHLLSHPEYDDGYLRSVHISTMESPSEIKTMTEDILNGYLNVNMQNASKGDREEYERMISIICSGLDKIDVTDGQSFSCFTSMRKKLIAMGEWNKEREDAYKEVLKGNFDIKNLGILIQPLKPFVATDVAKYSDSPTMKIRKNPLQDKNSEYLLVLAAALAKGAKRRSKLVAIHNFMEDSAYDGRVRDKKGTIIKQGTYNRRGIDTVHFDSVAKVGLYGIIDLDEFDETYDGSDEEYEQALAEHMLNKIKRDSPTHNDSTKKYLKDEDKMAMENTADNILDPAEMVWNTQYVDTIPMEDYIIQQEVPAHFLDHEQLYGSQMRILGISDITPGTEFDVDGTPMKDSALIDEYKNLHAENIRESFKDFIKDMGLDIILDENGNIKQSALEAINKDINLRNKVYKKLSGILQTELAKDAKYGFDIKMACRTFTDDYGVVDFVVPLMDPIQSKRIQMLLNSIIKKKINKQRINGGSLVQTTAYDENLHIKFKDENGEIIEETLEDYGGDVEAYKEFLSKKKASIAYYEVYAPVPNEVLELLMYEDGKVMSFEDAKKKFEGNKKLWERITTMIGYRIPTEDKYSMVPMKIVGFVPKAAGEVVIMPKEITYLTGSDFDIDKMYVIKRSFGIRTIKETKEGISKETIKDEIKGFEGEKWEGFWEDLELIMRNTNKILRGNKKVSLTSGIETRYPEDEPDAFSVKQTIGKMRGKEGTERLNNFIEWWKTQLFVKSFYELDRNNKKDKYERKQARDNRLIDLQWAVLTNRDTSIKMLNPGNFNEQKQVGRFIRILKSGATHIENGIRKKWTWESLEKAYNAILTDGKPKALKRALAFLDDLLENEDPHSVTRPSSKIYFQRQNMQGTQMVGIFANNNVSHAFMSFQRVGINLEKGNTSNAFYFDGVFIGGSENPTVLDPIQARNGQLVSKTIASFLAASVDTAKDPVLNDLNVNTFTGGVAMVLARLGFDTASIGLFLSQPIIIDLSNLYFKKKTDSYYTGDLAIEELAKELGLEKEDLNLKPGDSIKDSECLTKKSFIQHLDDKNYRNSDTINQESKDYQSDILKAFKVLFTIAGDLQELTFCTKFNSVSNAVGPTIADTMEDFDRVKRFIDKCDTNSFYIPEDNNSSYTDPREVIVNDSILKAFYESTIASSAEDGVSGASETIFSLFFPHYFPGFKNVRDYFVKNYLKNQKMNAKLYNQFLDAYMYYMLTYKSEEENIKPVIPTSDEDKKQLVQNLVDDYYAVKKIKGRKLNLLLDDELGANCLWVRKKDEFLAVDTLHFNGSLLNADAQEKVKIAWSDLIQSKDPNLSDDENMRIRRFGVDLFFYSLMRNGFGFSPKTLMTLSSVIVRMNALYGSENEYVDYLTGLRNLREVDKLLMGSSVQNNDSEEFKGANREAIISNHLRNFCDQFIRNHANNRALVPNIEEDNSTISGVAMENGTVVEIEFGVPIGEENKLYPLMISKDGKTPYTYITLTRRENNKPVRTLFRLDPDSSGTYEEGGKTKIKYIATNKLGLTNNFIEYDANSSLPTSFFKDIRDDSFDSIEDEDANDFGERQTTEITQDDDLYEGSQADAELTFEMELAKIDSRFSITKDGVRKPKEERKKALALRKKVYEAYRTLESGSELKKAFDNLFKENVTMERKQKTLNELLDKLKDACNINLA